MRIDLPSSGLSQPDNNTTQKTARGAAPANDSYESTGATTDRTEFSFDQPSIQSLTAQALSAPEIRQSRVSSLADAVSAGAYNIDPA